MVCDSMQPVGRISPLPDISPGPTPQVQTTRNNDVFGGVCDAATNTEELSREDIKGISEYDKRPGCEVGIVQEGGKRRRRSKESSKCEKETIPEGYNDTSDLVEEQCSGPVITGRVHLV